MNRIFDDINRRYRVEIHLLYRDRGSEKAPLWAEHSKAVGPRGAVRFSGQRQLRWALALWWAIYRRARSFDLIHFQGAYMPNMLGALAVPRATQMAFLPVLENGDLKVTGGRATRLFKRAVIRHLLARSTIGFALSEGIVDEFIEAGMATSRVKELSNAVDVATFSSPDRTPPSNGRARLGFVGKLGPVKRPHLLLEVIAELRARGYKAEGLFVGPFVNEAYAAEFQRRVEHLDLSDHVQVTGFTSEVAAHVNLGMDIFVLPSISEGLPGALVEALCSGLPAIVTAVGAMGRVVERSGAGIVTDGNFEGIADAVEVLLDASTWQQMSRNARDYAVQQFSVEAVADEYAQHFAFERRALGEDSVIGGSTSPQEMA